MGIAHYHMAVLEDVGRDLLPGELLPERDLLDSSGATRTSNSASWARRRCRVFLQGKLPKHEDFAIDKRRLKIGVVKIDVCGGSNAAVLGSPPAHF